MRSFLKTPRFFSSCNFRTGPRNWSDFARVIDSPFSKKCQNNTSSYDIIFGVSDIQLQHQFVTIKIFVQIFEQKWSFLNKNCVFDNSCQVATPTALHNVAKLPNFQNHRFWKNGRLHFIFAKQTQIAIFPSFPKYP